MEWELTKLTNIRKGEEFEINVTWQGKTRVEVGGSMLF
jgi:hypothetical protein